MLIREENNLHQLPPAPPIIIRQQAEALRTQAPLVIREKPPRPPGEYLSFLILNDVRFFNIKLNEQL